MTALTVGSVGLDTAQLKSGVGVPSGHMPALGGAGTSRLPGSVYSAKAGVFISRLVQGAGRARTGSPPHLTMSPLEITLTTGL